MSIRSIFRAIPSSRRLTLIAAQIPRTAAPTNRGLSTSALTLARGSLKDERYKIIMSLSQCDEAAPLPVKRGPGRPRKNAAVPVPSAVKVEEWVDQLSRLDKECDSTRPFLQKASVSPRDSLISTSSPSPDTSDVKGADKNSTVKSIPKSKDAGQGNIKLEIVGVTMVVTGVLMFMAVVGVTKGTDAGIELPMRITKEMMDSSELEPEVKVHTESVEKNKPAFNTAIATLSPPPTRQLWQYFPWIAVRVFSLTSSFIIGIYNSTIRIWFPWYYVEARRLSEAGATKKNGKMLLLWS